MMGEMPGSVMLVMIDHLSGEEMGHLMNRLYSWGANNVNLLPTQTKKNRPGYLVFIDIHQSDETAISENMAREFGIAGHHRLDTSHCHHAVSSTTSTVTIKCRGKTYAMDFPVKIIGNGHAPLHARAEYEGLVLICDAIIEHCGVAPSIKRIKEEIKKQILVGKQPVVNFE